MAAAAVDHTAEWKVPTSQDGWVLSHDALRLDMDDMSRLLEALYQQAESGRAVEQWQVDAAAEAWRYHAHMLTVHHESEEELYFPLMRTRFDVPAKQSADHEAICGLIEECGAHFAALAKAPDAATQAQELAATKAAFGRFHHLCAEHYLEEEQVTLPLIRKYFAPEEVTPTAKKISKMYGLLDMGNYLRPMTPEQRTAWMTRVRMPFFVQWLMSLQVTRYHKAVVGPLENAIDTAQGK